MSKSTIQSIVFNQPPWNITKALDWLKEHNKLFTKVDVTEPNKDNVRQLRFRQVEPEQFDRFTTETTDKDMFFVLGWDDNKGGAFRSGSVARVHSIIFKTPKWNEKSSKKWLRDHDLEPPRAKKLGSTFHYTLRPKGEFKSFTTVKTKDDINIVLGWSGEKPKGGSVLVEKAEVSLPSKRQRTTKEKKKFKVEVMQSDRSDNITS